MRGGGLEMLPSLCSPERELSCRFSGMGCPVRRTQTSVRPRAGRAAAASGSKGELEGAGARSSDLAGCEPA